MPWVKDDIRNTFPISGRDILRRKCLLALRHPVTWTPLVPFAMAIVAGQSSGKNLFFATGAALALVGAVLLFWRRRAPSLEAKVFDDLVLSSNLSQDSALAGLIEKLSRSGYGSYAVTLGGFAELKTKIERALYHDGQHTQQKEQVGRLVDDLVFRVVDQLEAMAKIEYRLKQTGATAPPPERKHKLQDDWQQMSGRTRRAHEILVETWHNLDTLLDPAPAREEAAAQLDETITDLREEIRIAADVRIRLLKPEGADIDLTDASETAADAAIGELFSAEQPEREPEKHPRATEK